MSTYTVLMVRNGFFDVGALGVAIYDSYSRTGVRVAGPDHIEAIARGLPWRLRRVLDPVPSQHLARFPEFTADLNRRLGSTGNAMSSVYLRDPLWCSDTMPVSWHLDALMGSFCL